MTLELIVGYPTEIANRQTPEVIQAQLQKVGIDLRIASVSNEQTYEERLTDKQGNLWLEIGNQNTASPCFLPSLLYYGKEANLDMWQSAFAPGPVGWPDFDDEIDSCNTHRIQPRRRCTLPMRCTFSLMKPAP